MVPGREPAAEVVGTGPGVDPEPLGARVAVEPARPCWRCWRCRTGHCNLCPQVQLMATPPYDGAFAEHLVRPADLCYRLDGLSIEQGALTEPLRSCPSRG